VAKGSPRVGGSIPPLAISLRQLFVIKDLCLRFENERSNHIANPIASGSILGSQLDGQSKVESFTKRSVSFCNAIEPKARTMRQGSLMSCPSTTLSVRSATKTSATNQVVFARWSDVILALWPLSILTDPFSQAMNANVRIFLDIFCDVGVLRGPAVICSADSGAQ